MYSFIRFDRKKYKAKQFNALNNFKHYDHVHVNNSILQKKTIHKASQITSNRLKQNIYQNYDFRRNGWIAWKITFELSNIQNHYPLLS